MKKMITLSLLGTALLIATEITTKNRIDIRSLGEIQPKEIPLCKTTSDLNTDSFIFIPLGKPMVGGVDIQPISVGLCKRENGTIKVLVQ